MRLIYLQERNLKKLLLLKTVKKLLLLFNCLSKIIKVDNTVAYKMVEDSTDCDTEYLTFETIQKTYSLKLIKKT